VTITKRTALTLTIILALLFSAVAGAFFVKSAQANPIISVYRDVPPPAGIQPPTITIHTPKNGSSYPKDITLTFDVTIPQTNGDKSLDAVTKIYYKGSWDPNEIIVSGRSIDLTNVPGGNLSVTIYAVGVGYIETEEDFREENGVIWSYNYYDRFKMTGYSTVSFTKDLVPPRINALSPPNGTYVTSDVELDFTVSEAASEILYCLDGKTNQTITDSLTLTGLTEGAHNVTLYAADLAGNAAEPKTLFFNVNLPETFPVVPVAAASAASVAVAVAGLLVYLRRRNHGENLVKKS
jgi:hypothetical protein